MELVFLNSLLALAYYVVLADFEIIHIEGFRSQIFTRMGAGVRGGKRINWVMADTDRNGLKICSNDGTPIVPNCEKYRKIL
jgi:hypothetical protein